MKRAICMLLALNILWGCESLKKQSMFVAELQNRVMQSIIRFTSFFEEKKQFKKADEFYQLEEKLQIACEDMGRVIAKKFSGEVVSQGLKFRLIEELSGCEQTAKEIEKTISAMNKKYNNLLVPQ